MPARVMVSGEARHVQRGWTALHFAANGGHLPVVEALLRAPDVDVNAKGVVGVRARRACVCGVRLCVRLPRKRTGDRRRAATACAV